MLKKTTTKTKPAAKAVATKKVAKKPAKAAAPQKKSAPATPSKKAPVVAKKAKAETKAVPAPAPAENSGGMVKKLKEKMLKIAKTVVDPIVEAVENVSSDTEEKIEKKPAAKAAKKAEKATSKNEASKSDAPKSVKATLKLLKNDKAEDDSAHWQELHEKFRGEKAQSYDMKSVFEAGKPLVHKLLGWGWIISNENDRLDVLFKDGRRTLISNYNPNR